MVRVFALGGVVVALDQFAKAAILRHLAPGVHIDVVPGWLTLTLVMNPGLAFGLWQGPGGQWRQATVGVGLQHDGGEDQWHRH